MDSDDEMDEDNEYAQSHGGAAAGAHIPTTPLVHAVMPSATEADPLAAPVLRIRHRDNN